jgi:cell division protein YceG involved in septum cleavage
MAKCDGSGRHTFARTFEEHLKNVEEYQKGH